MQQSIDNAWWDLDSAVNEYGRSIPVYDDGPWSNNLYIQVYLDSVMRVIRADNYQDAYEIMLDEMTPIDADQVAEAYNGDDLIEGFEYQPNATGTGIVEVSDYDLLLETTEEKLKEMGVILTWSIEE